MPAVLETIQVEIKDNSNLDAFGRLRTSSPVTLFEASHQYGIVVNDWRSSTTGGATVTADTDKSAAILQTGTASGDKAVHETLLASHYEPGKSQFISMTGILGASKANVRKRLGYFDANNGVFFEQTPNTLAIVKRSNVSGSVVDIVVPQALWSVDKFDGTGPSGIVLDVTKIQLFLFDLQWLGAGRVRIGFSFGGRILYAHEFNAANILLVPYMRTADLPGRYEIENVGTAASSTQLLAMCYSCVSEGGINPRAILFSASNGITTIGVTTRRPILSIRPKTTFNSLPNKAIIAESDYSWIVTGVNPAFYEIVYNGTLTGASFNSVNDSSIAEFDIAATAISGGQVKRSGYLGTNNPGGLSINLHLIERILLSTDVDAAAGDILSMVITSLSGTATVGSSITWTELR